MPFFSSIHTGLLDLLLPRYCCACSRVLHTAEHNLCLHCLYDLPLTRFESYPNNPLFRLFWGRVFIRQATALMYFKSSGRVRKMIHQMKYKGQPGLAYHLGYLLGETLLNSGVFNIPELILPVPLARGRIYKRGYNQCTYIAQGLAAATGAQLHDQILQSGRTRSTQTNKGRYDRYLNMQEGFLLNSKQLNSLQLNLDASVLLVDDVITTGATLESCVSVLQQSGFNQISIAALAWTSD